MVRSDSVAVAAIVVAVGAFFAPALFGDRTCVTWNMDLWHPWAAHASPEDLARPTRVADSARQFVVMRSYSSEALRAGRVPLWNPTVYCGTPFLANFQPAVFYPPNLALSLSGLDVPDQMTAYLVFHFLVAAVGMYALLRRWRLGILPSLVGTLLFVGGGHLGSRTGNQTMVSTAAWIPWLLWASRGWFERFDARSWGAMAAFLGLAGLAGFAQSWVFLCYVWAGLGLLEGVGRGVREPRRWLAWGAAGGVGILLASVHLLPTLEFIGLAQDAKNTPQMLASGTLHPWTLGKLVVPDLLGHPRDGNIAAHLLSVGSGFYFQTERSTAVYMGILPLALAVLVALSPGDRRRETFFALALGGLGLLFCFDTIFGTLATKLPGLGFSRPDRATILWSTGVAIAAALGAERLGGAEGPGLRRPANALGLAAGVAALGFAILVVVARGAILPDAVADRVGTDALARAGAAATVLAGLSLAVLLARGTGRLGGTAFLVAALALVAVDVGIYAVRMNILQPEASVLRPVRPGTSLAFLQERAARETPFRLFRWEPARSQFSGALVPSTPTCYGLDDALGFDSINLARYQELMAAVSPDIMIKRANFRGPRADDVFDSPLLDLMNVRYVAAAAPGRLAGLVPVHTSDLAIHENPDALERAFLVDAVRVVEDPERLVGELASPSFRPDLLALSEVPIEGLPAGPARAAGGAPGPCRIAVAGAERVEIEVAPERPALLVLADSWYPGWKASVDGVERPIHRVDHLFRGVVVRPGDERVTFSYEPASFRTGAALSIAALFLVGSALLRRPRERS